MGTVRRLILWDIDGTLISSGSITRRAFDLAVASAVGREPGEHGVSFGGKTDPQIALEILTALAVSAEDARGQLPAVMQALEREMGAAGAKLRREGAVLPGVRPILERLGGLPSMVQTVLTGSVEANARLKVGAFGLDELLDLDVGVYGSDGEDRTTFVPLALRKVESLRGSSATRSWRRSAPTPCSRTSPTPTRSSGSSRAHEGRDRSPPGARRVRGDLVGARSRSESPRRCESRAGRRRYGDPAPCARAEGSTAGPRRPGLRGGRPVPRGRRAVDRE